jgi:dihydrofolate synthase/folylpolyglutamate synthase
MLNELYSFGKFGSKLGLERISLILNSLGNPQNNYKCIIVGGSNGKGSTVEFISNCLVSAGFSVGSYFSPQIEEFSDRFRINGKNATKRDIYKAYQKVKAVCKKFHATFFEFLTAMAFVLFKEKKVDFAVLEVGLGGRLDATNIANPMISVLTSVSLEHTDVLGNTIEKIAAEKCMIARKGKPLICGFIPPKAKKEILRISKIEGFIPIFLEEKAKIFKVSKKLSSKIPFYSFYAKFNGRTYFCKLAAPGYFQVKNALCAIACASLLGINKKTIQKAISSTLPKFRMQLISSNPKVIADCAHNKEAAQNLLIELENFKKENSILLFCSMKDKDYRSILKIFSKKFDTLVLTEVSLSRSEVLSNLFSAAKPNFSKIILIKNPKKAYDFAFRLAKKNKGLLLVAGSIYLLSEIFGKEPLRIAQ